MQSPGGEPLRQRYLAAMGITPWLPRQALPGAAPSPRWEWRAKTAAAPAVPAPSPVRSPDPGVAAGALTPRRERSARPRVDVRALLGNDAPPASPAASAAPAPAVRPAPAAAPVTAAVPRFRILLLRYADCLVLNDLPLDPQQPVAPQHHRLLGAILAAVGLGRGEPRQRILSWPMFAVDSGHDQGADVARLMLREEAEFERLPQGLPLLLLGDQSGRHLVDAEHDAGAHGGAVVHGPSLNEMLRIPARKADLWQALQPLRHSRG